MAFVTKKERAIQRKKDKAVVDKITGKTRGEGHAKVCKNTDLPKKEPSRYGQPRVKNGSTKYVTGTGNPDAVSVSRNHNGFDPSRALVSDGDGGTRPRVAPTKFVPAGAKNIKDRRRTASEMLAKQRSLDHHAAAYDREARAVVVSLSESVANLLASYEKGKSTFVPPSPNAAKLAAFKTKQAALMEYRKGNPTKRTQRKLAAMESHSRKAA